jgi:glycosyltransferase involved in cell wall biosynthesis
MKVVHLITTIERGGAENQLLILCQEQIKIGNQLTVLYLKGRPELEETFSKIGVRSKKVAGNSLLTQICTFKRDLYRIKPDVVHAHLPRSELVAALSRTNFPLVISRHNAEKFFNSAPSFFSSFLARFTSKRSDSGIAISKSVRDFLFELNEVARGKDFHIVMYGYPFTNIHKKLAKTMNPVKYRFLTIGRLVPQKDYPTLLKGLSLLAAQKTQFDLSILGEGEKKSELEKLSYELDLESRIHWIGKVENTSHFYDTSDLFILASRYEGFGMVLVEAMDHSLPIVCANSPAAREVLGENYPGFFEIGNPQDLAQKVSWALNNIDTLVKAFSDRKRFFNAPHMAQKVQEIYKSIQKRNI